MSTYRIRIKGLVQGVFFRAQAKELADSLGIKGWVRNNSDGSVEIHAEGPDEALKQLEEWCRKGPTRAKVENVERKEAESENCRGFEIIR